MKSSFYFNIRWIQSSVTSSCRKQLSEARRQYNIGSIDRNNHKFQRFRSNWSTTCNDSKAGSTNCLTCQTTDIHYKSRHHNRKQAKINERMVRRRLNEVAAKYNRPLSKSLLIENHRMNCLKWAQDHKATDWNQVILSDETIIHLNLGKGLLWNFSG